MPLKEKSTPSNILEAFGENPGQRENVRNKDLFNIDTWEKLNVSYVDLAKEIKENLPEDLYNEYLRLIRTWKNLIKPQDSVSPIFLILSILCLCARGSQTANSIWGFLYSRKYISTEFNFPTWWYLYYNCIEVLEPKIRVPKDVVILNQPNKVTHKRFIQAKGFCIGTIKEGVSSEVIKWLSTVTSSEFKRCVIVYNGEYILTAGLREAYNTKLWEKDANKIFFDLRRKFIWLKDYGYPSNPDHNKDVFDILKEETKVRPDGTILYENYFSNNIVMDIIDRIISNNKAKPRKLKYPYYGLIFSEEGIKIVEVDWRF